MRYQPFARYFSKIAKSRSCAHFDVTRTPGIALSWSHCSGKVRSVFSEALIPSEKSRLFAPLGRQNFLKSALRAQWNQGCRAAKKCVFPNPMVERGRFCDSDIFSRKKPDGDSFEPNTCRISALHLSIAATVAEKMLHKVPWLPKSVSL